MLKKLQKAAIVVFSLSLTGLLLVSGAAWYFSQVLLYTGPHKCKPAHYIHCDTPAEINLNYRNISYQTEDGLNISAWLIERAGAESAIIMQHGRGATRREALRYAPALHRAGYTLLLPDARNCGLSDSSFNSFGYHEQKDVFAAVRFLKKKGLRIGYFGFSMGAATGILAMARDKQIEAAVFESAFSDAYDVLTEAAAQDYGLPEKPLLPIVKQLYEYRGNLRLAEISPARVIAKIAPRPVFVIHGDADERVPFHHGPRLFAAARKPKEFWWVKGGKHTAAYNANKAVANERISAFFARYLP